jgi:hypothetical protein
MPHAPDGTDGRSREAGRRLRNGLIPLATAAALVYHAIALWIPAMWGTIAFLILRRSRRQPLELRPTREERRRIRASRADAPA